MYNSVLVTGGSGFVGANLIKRLLDKELFVRATYHDKSPVILDDRIEYVKTDLKEALSCHSIVKDIDTVFMCAANTSGAGVIDGSPLAHVTPNIIMNTNMLDAAYSAGVNKFVFISSSTVYPVTDYPVSETEPLDNMFDKYFCVGWMKRFTEILCEMYATKINNKMNAIVIRPGNLYGELDDFEWETSHVLPAIMRRVVERQNPISVWGDGSDIKDFIYIQDFIDGVILATEKTKGFDIFNIASGKGSSIRHCLDLMLKIDGYEDAVVEYDSSKPTMIPKRFIDTTKANEVLGFKTSTSIEEGLLKTISWYRKSLENGKYSV